LALVELENVESDDDIGELLEMIEDHRKFTGSTLAADVIERWPEVLKQFVKVMPLDYKRVLMERKSHDEEQEATVTAEGPSD
jgi:glutamate synthase domain-containing protein 3